MKRSLAIREKALGPDHPDVGTSLSNLAVLYQSQGRYADAEPLYKRSLAIREKALGPDHPDVGTSLNNLAGLYQSQGRYAEAEPLFKRSLAIREKALGPDHPDVGTVAQQPGVAVSVPGPLRGGRAALSSAASPSARRRSDPTTLASPSQSGIWGPSSNRKGASTKRSRS